MFIDLWGDGIPIFLNIGTCVFAKEAMGVQELGDRLEGKSWPKEEAEASSVQFTEA
jgi:hypothetical protein